MLSNKQAFLYEKIAEQLAEHIRSGSYTVGCKLPSLRHISRQQKVSLATVVQAYQLLEQQGLIEAKNKSGYFVRNWVESTLKEPKTSTPHPIAKTVNVDQLAMSLVDESRQSGVVKLGAAVPQAELLPLAILSRSLAGAARRHYQLVGNYENSQGHIGLRRQIALLMADAGCHVNAEDIMITNGCLEALSLSLRAVTQPGDTVVIESPTYFGILQVIETLGLQALEVATHAGRGIDPGQLAEVIQSQSIAACILMPSFGNPLGSSMPDSHKRQVVELLRRNEIPLIEDDIYGFLSHTPNRPQAAKAWDKQGGVIYCSSFSKTIAPGLRIGWAIPGQHLKKMVYLKFLDNISTAIHPQLVMDEFLGKGSFQRHIKKVVKIYRARMQQLRTWVEEFFPRGTRMTNPQGGFLLWVELPEKYSAIRLYQIAMKNKIAIVPGILFSTQEQFKHHLRLSCGALEGEQARLSIQALGQLMQQSLMLE